MDRRNNARAKHTNWRSPTLKWRFLILFIVAFQLSYVIFTENDHVMSKVSFISGLTRSISRRSKNADDLIISRSKIKSKIFAHFNKNGHVLWKFDWLVDERSCKVYDLAKICDHDWKYTILAEIIESWQKIYDHSQKVCDHLLRIYDLLFDGLRSSEIFIFEKKKLRLYDH